jgi:hypothetical protein
VSSCEPSKLFGSHKDTKRQFNATAVYRLVTLGPKACRAQLGSGSISTFSSDNCCAMDAETSCALHAFGSSMTALMEPWYLRVFVRTFKVVWFAQRHEEAVQCGSGAPTRHPELGSGSISTFSSDICCAMDAETSCALHAFGSSMTALMGYWYLRVFVRTRNP